MRFAGADHELEEALANFQARAALSFSTGYPPPSEPSAACWADERNVFWTKSCMPDLTPPGSARENPRLPHNDSDTWKGF